ncbi:TadE-like protein [Xaviernesmea oryzae]|nr:TadE-like protein [Xaviernesmea oryzae]
MVLTPMMLLLFGGIEAGRVLWMRHALEKVATTSARCIGIRGNDCSTGGAFDAARALSYVQTQAAGMGIRLEQVDIDVRDSATCHGAAGFSQVVVTKTLYSAVPLLVDFLSSANHQLSAQACFPTQQA